MPPGQAKKLWSRGERLPAQYIAAPNYVTDHARYDLPPREQKKVPEVCGSLREAFENLGKGPRLPPSVGRLRARSGPWLSARKRTSAALPQKTLSTRCGL